MTTQLCQYPLPVYISYLNMLSSDIIANYDVFFIYLNSKDNFNIHAVENNGRNNVLFYISFAVF